MRGRGKIVGAMYDFRRRVTLLQTEIEDDFREQVDALAEKPVSVEVKEWREKHTPAERGYYWTLVAQTARRLQISTARLHNTYLRRCSSPDLLGGDVMIVMLPDTDEAEDDALEREKFHLKPTGNVREGTRGVDYRAYVVLRGSHSFDKEEYSRLIDIAVEGASEQGIETATPDELAKIKEAYKCEV